MNEIERLFQGLVNVGEEKSNLITAWGARQRVTKDDVDKNLEEDESKKHSWFVWSGNRVVEIGRIFLMV